MNLPPQNPWRVDSMPAPMPPPQYPPQQSEFINLGDNIPQGQMGSGWNPPSSAVPSITGLYVLFNQILPFIIFSMVTLHIEKERLHIDSLFWIRSFFHS